RSDCSKRCANGGAAKGLRTGCSLVSVPTNLSPKKIMTLAAEEFIRRFLLHVLPDRFQRIRYYGCLSNRDRQDKLALCRQLLPMSPLNPEPAPGDQPIEYDYRHLLEQLRSSLRKCPLCQKGRMIAVEVLAPATPLIDTS